MLTLRQATGSRRTRNFLFQVVAVAHYCTIKASEISFKTDRATNSPKINSQLNNKASCAPGSLQALFACPPAFQRRRFFSSIVSRPSRCFPRMQSLDSSPFRFFSRLLQISGLRGGTASEKGEEGRMEEGKVQGRAKKMRRISKEKEKDTTMFAKPRSPVLNPDVSKYEEELESKAQRVKDLLGDYLNGVDLQVFASPPLHYRMRCEFRMWFQKGDLHYAFFDPETKKPIFLEQYVLASERINLLMRELAEYLQEDDMARTRLYQVEMVANTDDEVLLCMVYKKPLDEEWVECAKRMSEKLRCHIIGRSKKIKHVIGDDHVVQSFEFDGKSYPQWQTENHFSQSNAHICKQMLTWAREQLGKEGRRDDDLLELYCGNGNFTLALSALFRKILATELDKYSVNAANACAKAAEVDNVVILPLSAEEATEAVLRGKQYPQMKGVDVKSYNLRTILVDPPRAGLDDASRELVNGFDEVLYVSCNPAKLIVDLEGLPNHKIVSAALFDQFPWTDHAEVAVKLVKK